MAVDGNGDIYVAEHGNEEHAGGISVYASSGESITTIPVAGTCNLAVASDGTVYAVMPESSAAGATGPVEKLVPSLGLPVSAFTEYTPEAVDGNQASTVAVDPSTGDLFVDEGARVAEYDVSGVRVGAFGEAGPGALGGTSGWGAGIAVTGVGAAQKIYVAQGDGEGQVEIFGPSLLVPDVETAPASSINPKGSATLNGTVNPDGVEVTGCRFEYGETSSYGRSVPCAETVGSGTESVPVTARLEGLVPGATYHFRFRASNGAAEAEKAGSFGVDLEFVMPPLPAIGATSVTNLTSTNADSEVSGDLESEVDPGGVKTTCMFEYGSIIPYENRVECEPGSLEGSADVAVKRHIEGLKPDVTYHWRVVATSDAGTMFGVDHTFIYDTNGEGLPDGRAYEMVTPPHKNAALVTTKPVYIGENGSRLIGKSVQCFADAESCEVDRGLVGSPYLFSRTSEGWVASALAPPESSFEANTVVALLSPEEGLALFSMPTAPMFEEDLYAGPVNGSYVDLGPGTPPADGEAGLPWLNGREVLGTGDLSRVVLHETPHLWSFDESTGISVYEFARGVNGTGGMAPILVGVSDVGQGNDLISRCNTVAGAESNELHPGEMSTDGEVVFFTAGACPEGGTGSNVGVAHEVPVNELFARVDGARADAHTVAISEPSALAAGAAPYAGCREELCVKDVNDKARWVGGSFVGASDDGSRAFFTSDQQLTDDAQQGGGNLYMYDFSKPVEEKGLAASGLVDVSAGDGSGLGPRVEGVVGIAPGGSRVYFVAKGVLTGKANASGAVAHDGANNLYVWSGTDASQPQGEVRFIAELPDSDSQQWSKNDNFGVANVSPDGRFLVFESHGVLTSDDTRGDGAVQIFRYDASTGELTRVSVGQGGFNDDGNAGVGDASIVPSFNGYAGVAGPARSDPSMSYDGSFVFFESPVALTPHALNDVPVVGGQGAPYAENVYEWHDGQVYLISDGRDTSAYGSTSAVVLLGSDRSGDNVFFTTTDELVDADTNTQLDIYDARVCRPDSPCVSSAPVPLPECSGEACHGIPAEALHAPSGGSATLNGSGNVSGSVRPAGKTKKANRKKKPARCSRSKYRSKHRARCAKRRKARSRRSARGGRSGR